MSTMVSVRLRDSEYNALVSLRGNYSNSEYLRVLLLREAQRSLPHYDTAKETQAYTETRLGRPRKQTSKTLEKALYEK